MDAKITKKRLNDFLSYEWIKLIALVAAGILLWSLIFTMTGIRLSVGQQFKIFFYTDVAPGDEFNAFGTKLRDKNALSFDVLEYSYESLIEGSASTVLQARFAVSEGDLMLITNTEEEDTQSNFKSFVDGYFDAYRIDTLMSDAKAYFEKYYDSGGKLNYTYVLSSFKERMRKDNRYKKEEDYQKGAILEAQRIETLKSAWTALNSYLEESKLVYYAKYTQLLKTNPDTKDITAESEARPYGIDLSHMSPQITQLFKIKEDGSANGLTLVVLDRKSKQPHLQYEVIPVIAEIFELNY